MTVRTGEIALADTNIPYMSAYGNITKALHKIQDAPAPERFTIDFLDAKLNLKGGGARPLIPFLKKTAFLASDGSPTSLYHRFRNSAQKGTAAAEALRAGYSDLYAVHEYVHDLAEPELRGLIVQVTGVGESSSTVKAIMGSFKALRAFADFTQSAGNSTAEHSADVAAPDPISSVYEAPPISGLNLGYTINLHLPSTSDPTVYNAIFRSLRENLLK